MTSLNSRCPKCEQEFTYQPSPPVAANLPSDGGAILFVIDCPHCFQKLGCDSASGTARFFEGDAGKQRIVFDEGFGAAVRERVEELNHYGTACADSGRFAEAEQHFRAALGLSRFHPLTWYQLGLAYFRAGNLAGAEESFRNALRSDPLLLQAWNNLGSVLTMQGRFDEAEACFDQGIAADANHAKFYLGKANIALQRGDMDAARSLLRMALLKDAGYSLARQMLQQLEAQR